MTPFYFFLILAGAWLATIVTTAFAALLLIGGKDESDV
jgi:hypothetical protein